MKPEDRLTLGKRRLTVYTGLCLSDHVTVKTYRNYGPEVDARCDKCDGQPIIRLRRHNPKVVIGLGAETGDA